MTDRMPAHPREAVGARGERTETAAAKAQAGAGKGSCAEETRRGEGACGESARGEGATSRLEPLYGKDGLARVQASCVAVFGLGGVGASCVEALARGGVGALVLFDPDTVQESNINRQAIAFMSTVGRRKADVMRAMVADINPAARVEAHARFVLAADVPALLDGPCAKADCIVDAIDTVSTKLALAQEAEHRGIRIVSSMGAANKVDPACLRFADLYETQNCPLCRAMRKEARKRGIRHLRVLYSCEKPACARAGGGTGAAGAAGGVANAGAAAGGAGGAGPAQAAAAAGGSGAAGERADGAGAARAPRGRTGLGTVSYLPPIMGQTIAGDVLRTLAGIGGEGT